MRVLRAIRAGRESGYRDQFWVAWAIAEDLVLLNEYPTLPTLTRYGELELKDLEREYPQILDPY